MRARRHRVAERTVVVHSLMKGRWLPGEATTQALRLTTQPQGRPHFGSPISSLPSFVDPVAARGGYGSGQVKPDKGHVEEALLGHSGDPG
jgi:hypothetical protein